MTDEQRERLKQFIKDETARMIAKGPEACRQYFVRLGTHNEDGSLTEAYGGKYTGEKP